VRRLAQLHLDDRDGITIAKIRGEIDLSNATELEIAISEALPNEATGLVVDLAQVEYLDSSGIGLLFNLARRVSRRQQELVIVVPGEAHVREILTLSGAADTLTLRESLDDALSELDADSHESGR
jgi:anti-anti-sigma factor